MKYELPVNHKGTPCPCANILCQEGYCSECQVYRDWIANPDKVIKKEV